MQRFRLSIEYFRDYFGKCRRSQQLLALLHIILDCVYRIIPIVTPSIIVFIITSRHIIDKTIIILLCVLSLCIYEGLNGCIELLCQNNTFLFRYNKIPLIGEKVLKMDYETVESPYGQLLINQAYECIYNGNSAGIERFLNNFSTMLSVALSILCCVMIGIYVNLYATIIIVMLNIAVIIIQNHKANWIKKNKEEKDRIIVQQKYMARQLQDSGNAKEFAVFRIKEWFIDVLEEIAEKKVLWEKSYQNYSAIINIEKQFIYLIAEGVMFFTIYMLASDSEISIPRLLLYVNAMMALNNLLSNFINLYSDVEKNSVYVDDLMEFESTPDFYTGRDEEVVDIEKIEFVNVSYSAGSSVEKIVDSISFEIKKGDKIAIIGENGSGKSTIMKLICGLYKPTEGEIFINNRNINEYSKDQLCDMFSCVFQDNSFFPFTVAENVSCKPENRTDYRKVFSAIRSAGLFDEDQAINDIMNKYLGKDIEKGISLSGGELQKLFIARMLYNLRSCLVLDEPTASLDPISEAALYRLYANIANDRISLFVSHRLGSTSFCNKVMMVHNGKIVEFGSRDDLIRMKGRYYEMFEMQKQAYYEE